MINDINADTPVQAILDAEGVNKRAAMTRLACTVFQKSDGRVLRAYTQFSPDTLASLIEAKRKGVFDFGETIRKLAVGAWSFPNDPQAVLKALDLAAEGQYDDIDLASLDVVDEEGRPLVDLTRLFPTMKKTRAEQVVESQTTAKPVEAPAPVEPARPSTDDMKAALEAARLEGARKAAEKKAAAEAAEAEALEQARLELEAAEGEEVVQTEVEHGEMLTELGEGALVDLLVQHVQQPILKAISTFSTNLAGALEGMHAELTTRLGRLEGEVHQGAIVQGGELARMSRLEQQNALLLQAIGVADRNLQQVLMYFVDPHMEFEQAPTLDDIPEMALPERAPVVDAPVEAAVDTQPPPEEPQTGAVVEETDSGDTLPRYTQEQLEAMDLADLRVYAESIGLAPARWHKTNVNRILDEYARLDG